MLRNKKRVLVEILKSEVGEYIDNKSVLEDLATQLCKEFVVLTHNERDVISSKMVKAEKLLEQTKV